MKIICRFLLKLLGWKGVNGVMPHKKAIIIAVPHTSAWDFVFAYLYYTAAGGVVHIVIKREFFFWPFGYFLKKMGAIPIDRSKGTSVVKQIIEEMNSHDTFHLAMTPEGTRKKNKRWKAGFHTIAKATGATVYMGFFDYGKRQIGWLKTADLADEPEESVRRVKAYYRTLDIKGKHPEAYSAED